MDTRKIVEDFHQAIENKDFTKAESLLAKDFRFSGATPEPIGAQEFLSFHRAFKQGLPDFKLNFKIDDVQNNNVKVSVRFSGTNTRDIPEFMPGMHVIPATQKSIRLPEQHSKVTVKNDKIVSIDVEPTPGGGIEGIFQQLGVELPEMHHH